MKRVSFCLAVFFLFSCAAPWAVVAQEDEEPPPLPPFVIVQKFFQAHFAHDMGFTEASLKAKQEWLTEDFYNRLMAELKKPVPKGEVPNINGDPFTDSQEYPESFKVTHSAAKGDKATVTVQFSWPDDRTTVQVALLKTAKGWLIDDIVYEKDVTLRTLMK
jgi:hypothetical protein